MKNKLYDYFKNLFNNNKIGHAFLICNCDLYFINDELNSLISDFFFEKKVNIGNFEDIIIINPENDIIKKEKVQLIREKVSTTSQTSNKKIYIINECEKMNDSAANSLLKLLEEPEENIYAFLISSNYLNVVSTIRSRCQLLYFYNKDAVVDNIKNIENENLNDIFKFINLIEDKKEKAIANYSFITKKIKDRLFIKNLFLVMLFVYRDSLNLKLEKKIEYIDNNEILKKISSSNEEKNLVIKMTLINRFINYLDYNLNTSLLLDRFIIELTGDINE